jgi:hypothetical protein
MPLDSLVRVARDRAGMLADSLIAIPDDYKAHSVLVLDP